ncbi:MAG: hypothetical protein IPN34_14530 [Planctomycetes bacterium]|nr:hypothetical protein [Planctomycetota bacterium]
MSRARLVALALLLGAGTLAYAAVRPVVSSQEPSTPAATKEHEMLLAAVGEYEGTLTPVMGREDQEPIRIQETITAIGKLWTQSRAELRDRWDEKASL